MGINIAANPSLRLISSQFCFFTLIFFLRASMHIMHLTVFAGILFSLTMVTARRASLGEKTMQAAAKADEPDKAMRKAARPASTVDKIIRAAAEADEQKCYRPVTCTFPGFSDGCKAYPDNPCRNVKIGRRAYGCSYNN